MKVVIADGFQFRFANAIDAYVFDEKDSSKPTFHGAPMKGVDIVAEFEDAYVYVELKDYDDPSGYDVARAANDVEREARQDSFKWLKNYLKYKFRDSHLYRLAEGKVDKPVHFICVLTFDNALNGRMLKELKRELPVGKKPRRWIQALATSCQVVNLENGTRFSRNGLRPVSRQRKTPRAQEEDTMTVNTLKTRDDHMPLQFAADGDRFKLQAGSEALSLSGETFGHKELRSRIEPWLTSLFQSEHLSLLAGSGLTHAVHYLAAGKTIVDDWQQINAPAQEQGLENIDE